MIITFIMNPLLSSSIARPDAQHISEVDPPAHRLHVFARRAVPTDRAAPAVRRAGSAVRTRRTARAGKHAGPARGWLGVELGEIAAHALVVGGRMGLGSAADGPHRLDRDAAQDVAKHRRIAIDRAAGSAVARLFAQLPVPLRDPD